MALKKLYWTVFHCSNFYFIDKKKNQKVFWSTSTFQYRPCKNIDYRIEFENYNIVSHCQGVATQIYSTALKYVSQKQNCNFTFYHVWKINYRNFCICLCVKNSWREKKILQCTSTTHFWVENHRFRNTKLYWNVVSHSTHVLPPHYMAMYQGFMMTLPIRMQETSHLPDAESPTSSPILSTSAHHPLYYCHSQRVCRQMACVTALCDHV